MTRAERRWRRTLLDACLPGSQGLPGVELTAFWLRFDAAAPAHLRWGLRLATVVFGLGPLLLGRAPLRWLGDAERDAVLRRLARWPGLAPLAEVVKVVACLALFQDPAAQARVRNR